MSADLVAFLWARYDETEAWARAQIEGLPHEFAGDLTPAQALAVHVLREVEVGREIVAEHAPSEHVGGVLVCARCYGVDPEALWCPQHPDAREHAMRWPCPTIRHLAAVYSGHPGYRQEWKP